MLNFSGFCRSEYRSDLGYLARKFEFWSRYVDGTDTLVFADENLFWNVNIPPYHEKTYNNSTVLWYVFCVTWLLYIFATWRTGRLAYYLHTQVQFCFVLYTTQRHFIYFVFVWRTIKRSAVSVYQRQPKISKVSLNPKNNPKIIYKVETYPKIYTKIIPKVGTNYQIPKIHILLLSTIHAHKTVHLSQTNSLKCPWYTNT